MTAAWIVLGALVLAAWGRLLWLGFRTDRALVRLADVPEDGGALAPVSVVVPCRNEAPHVERTVRSLLAQDLPGLEVVAVDDRSTDGTGAVLDRLAAEDRRLSVIHVRALPPGWLGKNHACAEGARRSTGDWILFTDGDVVFGPGALRRALAFARRRGLGHLAAAPRFVAPGFLERAFVTAFAALLSAALRIWELPRAGTRGFAGVGAFNLVRRDAYLSAGGHARLALEVVDDVKLGLLLRRSGVAQGMVSGGELIRVRWQHGFLPSVLGLVKNAFAGVEYRPGRAALFAGAGILAGAGPLALALLAPVPAARALGAAALLASVLVHAGAARRVGGGSGLEGLLMPGCAILLGGVLLASAAAAARRGGVLWRGTLYPLSQLRAGCLRADDLPISGAAGWPDAPGERARQVAP